MTTKSEIKKEVKIALSEIGNITPWFEKDFNAWLYSSSLYPVAGSNIYQMFVVGVISNYQSHPQSKVFPKTSG